MKVVAVTELQAVRFHCLGQFPGSRRTVVWMKSTFVIVNKTICVVFGARVEEVLLGEKPVSHRMRKVQTADAEPIHCVRAER